MAVNQRVAAAAGLAEVRKQDLPSVLAGLMDEYTVVAPVKKGKKSYSFEPVTKPETVCLDYNTTILPPKKALHRPFQTLFSFRDDQVVEESVGPERMQILFGVHPCDVHAIEILDMAYTKEYPDPYYAAYRSSTLIVALNCTSVGENCFCRSMGTGPEAKSGYDLVFTDIGDSYLVEEGSAAGVDLLEKMDLEPSWRVKLVEKEHRLRTAERHFSKKLDTAGLNVLLEENFRHPIWSELKEQCLGCGSCTMVCPTCFCYNVVDQMDLDLKGGKRQREWDSCMLLEYSEVAMGHNFRRDLDARIKQRIYHKLAYYEPQFGTIGCVGCGRCIETCIKGLDITRVIAALRGE